MIPWVLLIIVIGSLLFIFFVNVFFCLKFLKYTIGPTSGFTGPYFAWYYCYDASPQNPSRHTSGDPWRWADSKDTYSILWDYNNIIKKNRVNKRPFNAFNKYEV